MTTEAAGTAVTEEAVAPVAADLGDLSTKQVEETSTEELAPEAIDTDSMSDEDFVSFMDNQLASDSDIEAGAPILADEAPVEEEAELPEGELVDEAVGTPTGEGKEYTFKISGQDITVSDPADIERLLERGLNSAAESKAGLPAYKLNQMLANNELADEGKLSRMIDISKGDMGALRELLKEKGIDPYDLASAQNADGEEEVYTPNDHSVSDSQVALNQVLDSLQDTEAFATTADVVMEQWDPVSRKMFMDNPKNFTILNAQVEDGTYKAISDEMVKMDILGKLPIGGNQFEIYRAVGDQMFAENKLPGQAPAADKIQPTGVETNQPTAEQRLQQAADTQRRKRAVAPNRSVPQTKTKQQDVPSDAYSSSDEEFQRRTAHLFKSM